MSGSHFAFSVAVLAEVAAGFHNSNHPGLGLYGCVCAESAERTCSLLMSSVLVESIKPGHNVPFPRVVRHRSQRVEVWPL